MRTTPCLLLTLIPLAGCVDQNARSVLGDSTPVESLAESPAVPSTFTDDPPSLTSLSRDHWPATEVLVPVDGVGHRPTYRGQPPYALHRLPRQRGEFPTAETALDLDGHPSRVLGAENATETVAAPLGAAVDAVLIPPRLIVEPQWTTQRSPAWSFQRWPGPAARTLPAAAAAPVAPPAPAGTPVNANVTVREVAPSAN